MQKKLIQNLQKRISDSSDEKTRSWFNNYLKGSIEYRGLKTPEVRKLLLEWSHQYEVNALTKKKQYEIVLGLFSSQYAEDKFAGILYLQEFLLKGSYAESSEIIHLVDQAFKKEYFFDWSTTDWLCVRVLDPIVLNSSRAEAEKISSWRESKNLWQRRTSIVSFRGAAKKGVYWRIIKETIGILILEEERFIQTGIGWLIADLSKVNPNRASKVVEKHIENMSLEIVQRHTKHLPNHSQYLIRKKSQLARHEKRTT